MAPNMISARLQRTKRLQGPRCTSASLPRRRFCRRTCKLNILSIAQPRTEKQCWKTLCIAGLSRFPRNFYALGWLASKGSSLMRIIVWSRAHAARAKSAS